MIEQSLATRAVRGAFWTGGGIAIQLVVTLIFFRVLNLEDMGYFTWAQRLVVLCPLFSALGLNDALVKYREASNSHFNAAFWTCCLAGLAIYAALVLGGEAMGRYVSHWAEDVEADAFVRVLKPLALIVPFASVSGVVRARLARELQFRAIAISEVISTVVAAIVGLGLLFAGYGIESAVWNAIVREVALLVSLWWSAAWMPGLSLRWRALRQLLRFGLNVAGANVFNYVNSNLDKMYFVPVLLGPVANALYSFAYQYTMVPLSRAAMILTRVSFPAFSRVQNDHVALRRAYIRTVAMIALLAWPALVGGYVYAPEFLQLVKGDAMLEAVTPLRMLILAGMAKAVGTVVGSIFLAKGKANWSFRWTVVNLMVFVPLLFWGVRYGLEGVAMAITAMALLSLAVTQVLVNRLIALPLSTYVKALIQPGLIAGGVGGALLASKPILPAEPLLALGMGGLIGACVYLLGVRWLAWPLVMQFWRDFRGNGKRG